MRGNSEITSSSEIGAVNESVEQNRRVMGRGTTLKFISVESGRRVRNRKKEEE